ncbi:hypothetical protein L195_g056854, partial [Trifolium pratense]
ESTKPLGQKSKNKGIVDPSAEKERSAPLEGVQVGGILVKLGAQNVKLAHQKTQKEGDMTSSNVAEKPVDSVKDCRVSMRSYRTKFDDAEGVDAQPGVLSTCFFELDAMGEGYAAVHERGVGLFVRCSYSCLE